YIALEAANNAIRHGRPHRIDISFHAGRRTGRLTVSNDGEPLPANEPRLKGMGLRIMQYRAAMCRGTFQIRSAAGGGAVITVTFDNTVSRDMA
ncbi:MAG: hypothetical protein JW951_08720, partial [Lentisphaerae bacterium]|nr:hypothetical protein [Lentisphaerota bacterium]